MSSAAAGVAHASPVLTTVPFGPLTGAVDIASDSAGDRFVADEVSDQVIELPAGATSSSQRVILPFDASAEPVGVAVDGSGDVFISDQSTYQVVELPAGATSSAQQVILPFTGGFIPGPIATDSHDNVYVVNLYNDVVVELPAGATTADQEVTLPFSGLVGPRGITIDGSGNVLVADGTRGVVELPPGATSPDQQSMVPLTAFTYIIDVAVDSAGDVFGLDVASDSRVIELPKGATSSSQQATIATGLTDPRAITLEADGTLDMVENGTFVDQLTRYLPSTTMLAVASTPVAHVPFAVRATVTDTAAALAPSGTVTIRDGLGNRCRAIVTDTVAGTSAGTCKLTEDTSGTHTLKATFHPASHAIDTSTGGPHTVTVRPHIAHADVAASLSCPHRIRSTRSRWCALTVTNTGPQAATKVSAATTVHRPLVGSRCRPHCTWWGGTATWRIGRLAKGARVTVMFKITGHRRGTARVRAAATAATLDPRPRDNTAIRTVLVVRNRTTVL